MSSYKTRPELKKTQRPRPRNQEKDVIVINNIKVNEKSLKYSDYFKDIIIRYRKDTDKDIEIDVDKDVLRYILKGYDEHVIIKYPKMSPQFMTDVIIIAHMMQLKLDKYIKQLYRLTDRSDVFIILYMYLKDNREYKQIIKQLDELTDIELYDLEILEYIFKLNPYIILDNLDKINEQDRKGILLLPIAVDVLKEYYEVIREYLEPYEIETKINNDISFGPYTKFNEKENKYKIYSGIAEKITKGNVYTEINLYNVLHPLYVGQKVYTTEFKGHVRASYKILKIQEKDTGKVKDSIYDCTITLDSNIYDIGNYSKDEIIFEWESIYDKTNYVVQIQ